jgi:putative colanic acid biosynthesis acetyltransferase WcaF
MCLRPALLRVFGGRVSYRCLISGSVHVHFPWLLDIAGDVAISDRVTFYNLGGVSVGPRSVISQDVYICGGTHDYTSASKPLVVKPISIEADVWIGAGAFIGPGVRVGRGAIVGARAVVFRDVPPWKVVVGNPAKVIKDRILRDEQEPRCDR